MEISASLVNLLGFTVGIILYSLLMIMVFSYRERSINYLLVATALAGILWNSGELFASIFQELQMPILYSFVEAVSFSALGFLAPFVIHSSLKDSKRHYERILVFSGYVLGMASLVINLFSFLIEGEAPSKLSLQVLAFGSAVLIVVVLAFLRGSRKKIILAASLAIFMISAFHLSVEQEEKFWLVELVAHQASLPLAIFILLQDYRFAFADLFLKRALLLILLVVVSFTFYSFLYLPLLRGLNLEDLEASAILLGFWVLTALMYPVLNKKAKWLVEVILRRGDYEKLKDGIILAVQKLNSSEEILEVALRKISESLGSAESQFVEVQESYENLPKVEATQRALKILIPTTEPPSYLLVFKGLSGGRKLLSEEIEALKTIALLIGRRIDLLRVNHERCEKELREQEFSKLATEAQLAALRAQINPHFLFNSLTTIGYLIQSSPEKAFSTLMNLTQLLRALLRSTDEFITVEEEIRLIQAYLEIEKARFEERLSVEIYVPKELEQIKIPSLLLQPLVENAIKHGISRSKSGGKVKISAELLQENGESYILFCVYDNGCGFDLKTSKKGIGLTNISRRLENYYKGKAELRVEAKKQKGTKAMIKLPLAKKSDFVNVI
ncbi:MAG: histidine kinase [Pyrinomonadaceae bacterium]|nr:histidine kinase [Pyrinomonadaceae bacterium]MCX7639113.1 histidine kinase [Pyrinomonadaceae bacterium]MDW8303666.1 histidine kinase [Acidobacteriota bacterium]